MSVVDILLGLVYEDEKLRKFIYFHQLLDQSEGRWKTDKAFFVELKIAKSRRIFEAVILLKTLKIKFRKSGK